MRSPPAFREEVLLFLLPLQPPCAWQSNEFIDSQHADPVDSYQTQHRDDILFRGFLHAAVLR